MNIEKILLILLIVILGSCSYNSMNENNFESKYPILFNNSEVLQLENVRKPLKTDKIDSIEKSLGIPLPDSYKDFLKYCGGFWAKGGVVQLDHQHPFIHKFNSYEELTAEQK